MQEIRKASFHRVEAWWEQAVNTPQVARFLSGSTFVDNPSLDLGWSKKYFLSDDNLTLLSVGIDRTEQLELNIGLWSLQPKRFAKALACGRAIKLAMRCAQNLNARTINFSAAASNADSLRLLQGKFQQYEWGVRPQHFWDSHLCQYVDGHYFSIILPSQGTST